MVGLSIGQDIGIQYGGTARVLGILGSGGQGTVYRVDFHGRVMALKWYDITKISSPEEFRRNIENNIDDGSPDKRFVWPQFLTEVNQDGEFGYLMELMPDNYVQLTDVLSSFKQVSDPLTGRVNSRPVLFASLYANLTAAINIVGAMRELHRVGKSYQDLNDGGYFIDMNTGDVLVCDCDNIAPEGCNFGISGKPGYMAPEIVRGMAVPDVQTDKYSLAVLLFRMLFRADPLEGARVLGGGVLTENARRMAYGNNGVFIFDPNDASNRPVAGKQDHVVKLWEFFPQYVKDAFIRSFTVGMGDPAKRLIENEWQKLFIRLRAEILACICGAETFCLNDLTPAGTCRCPACGREYAVLEYNSNSIKAPIYCGYKMRVCELDPHFSNTEMVVGEVVENRRDRGNPGIKNCSPLVWRARLPDGKVYDVVRGKGMPVWGGLHIEIGNTHARVMQPSPRRIK